MELIPFTEEQLQMMGDLYVECKWSTRRLGDHYGISATAVARRLKARGVTLRSGGNLPVPDDVLVTARTMRKQGALWQDISKRLGWSERTLYKAMK